MGQAMSLSGRSYSEREKLAMYEERLELYNKAGGICEHCGKRVSMDAFQVAHRIPNSPTWRKKYGKEIIDHKLNKAVTHPECNSAVLLVNDPVSRELLIDRILADIDRGGNYSVF